MRVWDDRRYCWLFVSAGILGIVIALMEEGDFPGWGTMIVCVLAGGYQRHYQRVTVGRFPPAHWHSRWSGLHGIRDFGVLRHEREASHYCRRDLSRRSGGYWHGVRIDDVGDYWSIHNFANKQQSNRRGLNGSHRASALD